MNTMTSLNAETALATGVAASAFDAAMIAYESAEATFQAQCKRPGKGMSDEEGKVLGGVRCDAFEAAISTPAPSWPAFGRKVALIAQEMIDFDVGEEFGAPHLLDDVARLAVSSAARAAFAAAAADLIAMNAAIEALPAGETDELQLDIDNAVVEACDATHKLMATPAPDIASLVDKLRIMADEDAVNWTAATDYLKSMLADAERLMRGEPLPARTAQPDRADWDAALAAFEAADAADQVDPDGEHEDLQDAMCEARDRLALLPAPDNTALAYKIAFVNRFDMWSDGFMDGAPTRSIMADANRLAGLDAETINAGLTA